VAFAMFYTANMVYVTRSAAPEMRGTVVGMSEAVGATSITLTPFAALPLQKSLGFVGVFELVCGLALVVAVLAWRLRPLPKNTTAGSQPAAAPPKRGFHFRPLVREAVLPGLVACCLVFATHSYISLMPLIASQLGVTAIGAYLAVRAFCTVPTRFSSGLIADRVGKSWAIVPGFLLAGTSMLLLHVLRQPGWVFIPPAMFGIGMGIASPAITSWMLGRVERSQHASAINTLTLMSEATGFLGTWLVGVILQAGYLPGLPLATFIFTGLAIYAVTQRRAQEGRQFLKGNKSIPERSA
jgi:predicted MFS family arabinose efflux permease